MLSEVSSARRLSSKMTRAMTKTGELYAPSPGSPESSINTSIMGIISKHVALNYCQVIWITESDIWAESYFCFLLI